MNNKDGWVELTYAHNPAAKCVFRASFVAAVTDTDTGVSVIFNTGARMQPVAQSIDEVMRRIHNAEVSS